MARRHWLDPIARQLLIASGQLPQERAGGEPPAQGAARASNPGAASQQTAANQRHGDRPSIEQTSADLEHAAAVERELLALKLKQQPGRPLQSADEVIDAAALGWRLDVNRAAAADWARLPGLRPEQIDLLVRLQAGGVQLSGPEDLQRLLEVPEAVVQSWLPVLVFRWYSEPPGPGERPTLDLNRASAATLQSWGLSAERCRRLLAERARQPFQDLADLQQRLQLPPALVEDWIGRVRFSAGPAGPQLPPGTRGQRGR